MKRPKTVSDLKLPKTMVELIRLQLPLAIHDEVAYENALNMVDALASILKPTKDQLEYLDTMAIPVGAYESGHYAIDTSDLTGLDMLKHLIGENEMSGADLGRLLGVGSPSASMILSGKRPITADHARQLARRFCVNPGLFIAE